MYRIEIKLGTSWVGLPKTYETRMAAEWAIGEWRSANRCFEDPFRVMPASQAHDDCPCMYCVGKRDMAQAKYRDLETKEPPALVSA